MRAEVLTVNHRVNKHKIIEAYPVKEIAVDDFYTLLKYDL